MAEAATVTLLFTDLVGSTELKARLGDERAEELRRTHFRLLRDQIASHHGDEVKSLGDGLMVAFASPSDAVGCAVAMQQSIDRQNIREPGGDLSIRVGLHCGEVTREEGDYFGTPVDVAKRLCDAADGGTILASDLVRGMVGTRGGFVFTGLGRTDLKGVAEPVVSYEVAWERAGIEPLSLPQTATLAPDRTPLAGRSEEHDRLRDIWKLARSGQRQLVLLAGEPGIGKTRLALEFARVAHEDGSTVLFGRCEEEALCPYQPFVEALEFYVASCPLEELRAQVDVAGEQIVRLVPDLARRLPGIPALAPGAPESDRYRLFESVSRFIGEASRFTPLVLVLDDIHWADKPTLLLLKHMRRAAEPASLLIVGTYRDTELGRTHPLEEALTDLMRDRLYERVPLKGLAEDEIVAFLDAAAQQDTGRQGRELAHALEKVTEGNPFFMEQILGHLVETGRVYQRDGIWTYDVRVDQLGLPEGVKQVIGQRLSRLSEPANRALAVASVVGREFDLEVVERVVADMSTDDLVDVFEQAVGVNVVAEVTGRLDRYTFTHALVRQTLYEELTTSRRVRLHRRVGQTLEQLHVDDLEPYLGELAYHFGEAAEGGDADKAIDYAKRAGDQAVELLAFEEAVGFYERALEVVELDDKPDESVRCNLLISLGDALRGAGDPHRGIEVCERAIALAKALSSPELLARSVLGFLDASWLGRGFFSLEASEHAQQLLREALGALGEGETALHALLEAAFPRILLLVGSSEEIGEHARRAMQIADELDDDKLRAAVLPAMATAASGPAELPRYLAISQEIIRIAEETGDAVNAFYGHLDLLIAMARLGDTDGIDRELSELTRRAEELRQANVQWFPPAIRAMRALMDGHFDEAERLALDAFEIGQSMGANWALGQLGALLFALRLYQGRLGELEEAVRAQVAQYPLVVNWRAALTHLLAVEGRFDEARELFEDEARELFEGLAVSNFESVRRQGGWLVLMYQLAEACAILGDSDRAETIYGLLRPYGGQNIVVGPGNICVGSVSRSLGLLAATMSKWSEAEQHFEDAIAFDKAMGTRPAVAMNQYEYARMLQARNQPGDIEKASELLEQMLVAAHDMGMQRLILDGEALLGESAHA